MTHRQIVSRSRRARGRRERGIALVIALFAVATLLLAAASGLLVGSSNTRATRNYRGASQVHFAAEAGISHALQVINGVGVVNFQNDVVNGWSTTFGAGTRSFGALPGFRYTVNALANGANPADLGSLVATATGPEGVRNTVVARLQRTDIPTTSPGAVYLASDSPTNATFNGNAWAIDGNDHNYTGGAGPGAPIPGISTRNAANTQEAVNSLNAAQADNVTGLGYQAGPPLVPSVMTSPWAPTSSQMEQIVADLLALPGVIDNAGGNINGNVTFGTEVAPQITHFTTSTTIKGNGNASGAGIMIIDGDLTIQGTLDFKGLVIVRGRTAVVGDTEITGNATIYGSLWTNDINLVVGGSAVAYYSTQGLALANQVSVNSALPTPMAVLTLADCALVPSGSGGCP